VYIKIITYIHLNTTVILTLIKIIYIYICRKLVYIKIITYTHLNITIILILIINNAYSYAGY